MVYSVKCCALHPHSCMLTENDMITDALRYSLLLEFYGALLTERQYELVDYYHNDDLSLSEISELTGITRQGVRDGLKKARQMLVTYEEKLGMYEKYTAREEAYNSLKEKLDLLIEAEGIRPCDELNALIAALDTLQIELGITDE